MKTGWWHGSLIVLGCVALSGVPGRASQTMSGSGGSRAWLPQTTTGGGDIDLTASPSPVFTPITTTTPARLAIFWSLAITKASNVDDQADAQLYINGAAVGPLMHLDLPQMTGGGNTGFRIAGQFVTPTAIPAKALVELRCRANLSTWWVRVDRDHSRLTVLELP